MKDDKFRFWMELVDEDLLEEAQQPVKKTYSWIKITAGLAACFAISCCAYVFTQPTPVSEPSQNVMLVNPMKNVDVTEVEKLGYQIPLDESAQNSKWFLIEVGSESDVPMAQVGFEQDNVNYICRAQKTQQAEDISGIYADWSKSLDWNVSSLEMQLRENDSQSSWVGWYDPEMEMQWCLSANTDAASLLQTAQGIVERLGYDLTVAPEQAKDVKYQVWDQDGLIVGETVFALEDKVCSYRMAASTSVDDAFADISGKENYSVKGEDSVLWCPARLSFDEGGAGKIVWFDVVPGLLYSLHVDSGASEEMLLELARQLFEPAQGDVG